MSNKDIFIIITRMTGGPSEFNEYFGNNGILCVVLDNNYDVLKHEKLPDNLDTVQLIFFRGEANKYYDQFYSFLERNQSGKTLNIVYHEGITPTKQTKDFLNNLNKIKKPGSCIVSYSSGSHQFTTIKDLGECIGNLLKGTECGELKNKCEEVKKYIKDSCNLDILTHLLHLFLPLDIDMQAIKILLEGTGEQKRNEEAAKYLKVMLDESKLYHKRILIDAQELLNQIPDKKKKEVQALFDDKGEFKIKDFVDTLIKLQPNKIPEKEFFNDGQNKELKLNIKKFHNWYCALAECLRGGGACEE